MNALNHKPAGHGQSRHRSVAPAASSEGRLVRIGAAAAAAGVTERALRYYEEKGLLEPAGRTPGGARCYSGDDITRVAYIKQLQNTLALDLADIATILSIDDRTSQLKATWQDSTNCEQRRSILQEASSLLQEMRSLVVAKRAALDTFLADTEAKLARIDAEIRRIST